MNSIEWKMVKLAKNCTIKARIGWQGLRSDEYKKSGEYMLITGTDFDNGFINFSTCSYVDEWRYAQDKNIQLQNEDVLITKDGTIGKIAFVKGLEMPATLNSGVFVIRPKENTGINPEYLSLVFKSSIFTDFLDRITAGSTIVHLYQKDIVKFDFPIPYKNGAPDLEAQRQIAQKLGDMDSLIAAKEKLLAKKRNLKVAAMQHLIKDNEGENWKKVKLGEVFTIKHGYGFEGEFFSNENNNKVVLTPGNFKIEGGFQSQDTPIFYLGNYPLSFNLKPNDLVVTMTDLSKNSDTLGNPLLIPNDGVQYLHNQRIGLIKFLDDSYDKDFIFWLLCTKKYHNSIVATAAGSTVKHTSPKRICSIDVFVPTSKNEQHRIASILSDMDSEIAAIEKEIAKLLNLKTAMMQKMFCFEQAGGNE